MCDAFSYYSFLLIFCLLCVIFSANIFICFLFFDGIQIITRVIKLIIFFISNEYDLNVFTLYSKEDIPSCSVPGAIFQLDAFCNLGLSGTAEVSFLIEEGLVALQVILRRVAFLGNDHLNKYLRKLFLNK